jgi:methylthioribose-1-phosphate isomerase
MSAAAAYQTLRWLEDDGGCLALIDQTRLPLELLEIRCPDVAAVGEAIRMLRVRGAPAIGIAAAYGLCLGLKEVATSGDEAAFFERLNEVCDYLSGSRPTAVNLFWALERMRRAAADRRGRYTTGRIWSELVQEARRIHDEDRAMCRAIGRHGAALLQDGQAVLTHCNAGGLATSEYGTALSVLFTAWDNGKRLQVYVDETRPLLQGARLTTWELSRHGIPTTLICDSMAAQVMREGRVQSVITGADRIAANGDTANKIGTYGLAVLAAAHQIPFYVAAPSSTFDLSLADGRAIPIEERGADEITCGLGRQIAPDGVDVYNPAFDVTPAALIAAIITERGLIRPVTTAAITSHLEPAA